MMGVTSVRVQAKGQVTIPKEIREKLKLQPGDLVVFVDTDDGVMVKPAAVVTNDSLREEVTAVVRSIRERFSDYSAEEIDALVDEALRDTRGS
jgi:AbrB family looped-hinge helix DNA binding protein